MRSTDEVYGSLAYDGAPLLRDPLCISRASFVHTCPYWNIRIYVDLFWKRVSI